jgi:hypothetical protein
VDTGGPEPCRTGNFGCGEPFHPCGRPGGRFLTDVRDRGPGRRRNEIDRIISRTLAYAIVTGLLAGVYADLVLLATEVLTVTSPVAVAAATLATAALFNPVRRRVQRIVDRRFNRARYDAERTLDAFAAGLQGAVDLDSVRDGLVGVVHRALEPAHVSVWVRERPDL